MGAEHSERNTIQIDHKTDVDSPWSKFRQVYVFDGIVGTRISRSKLELHALEEQ